MGRITAAYAAVDIVDNMLVYLQLGCDQGQPFVYRWYQQPIDATITAKFQRAELMTVMEHRALYYQQLTQTDKPADIDACVKETFGSSATDASDKLQVDYQHTAAVTHVVSAHASQVKKRQRQFTTLSSAIRIVEPAFQAVMRAANYLLSRSELLVLQPTTEWLIVELNQPLSTCVSCQFGVVRRLSFIAESDLPQLIEQQPLTLYLGSKDHFSETVKNKLECAVKLSLPSTITAAISALPEARAFILFGNALRGFNQWHH